MTAEEQAKVTEIVNREYERSKELVNNAYSVFKDFFGEAKVDLQQVPSLDTIQTKINRLGLSPSATSDIRIFVISSFSPFVLIYYPSVIIENEYGRTHIIKDLYIKVPINGNGGIGRFSFNRATYTEDEWTSDYLHSHVPGIPKEVPSNFLTSCLGTGPIKRTLNYLSSYDEYRLKLFCLELDKYVHTESISGVPYRRMESIGGGSREITFSCDRYNTSIIACSSVHPIVTEFITYFIKLKKLKFKYVNSQYSLGMTTKQFTILISNEFIKWYNQLSNPPMSLQELKYKGIIDEAIIKNNKLYYYRPNTRTDSRIPEGYTICTFKNNPVNLRVIKNSNTSNNSNKIYIFNSYIISRILNIILSIINFTYESNIPSNHKKIRIL